MRNRAFRRYQMDKRKIFVKKLYSEWFRWKKEDPDARWLGIMAQTRTPNRDPYGAFREKTRQEKAFKLQQEDQLKEMGLTK